jgi:hypothetical protein
MAEHNGQNQQQDQNDARDVSRRDFVAMSVAAGVVAATGAASAQRPLTEKNVDVKTPDGTSDSFFVHPAAGMYPECSSGRMPLACVQR